MLAFIKKTTKICFVILCLCRDWTRARKVLLRTHIIENLYVYTHLYACSERKIVWFLCGKQTFSLLFETSLEKLLRKNCGEHWNENISTNYQSQQNPVRCVWPMVKEKKKIAKLFAPLWKLYRVESFYTHLTDVPSHSISKKQKKKNTERNVIYANWWKFIYLHMMFPAVNIYSKSGREIRELSAQKFIKILHFHIFHRLQCTHKRRNFPKEEYFLIVFQTDGNLCTLCAFSLPNCYG